MFSMGMSNNLCISAAVQKLLYQTEMLLGPLSTEDLVVEGDNDRAILTHNFKVILKELTERVTSSNSIPQTFRR